MIRSLSKFLTTCLLVFFSGLANANSPDSFFDIFIDVRFDEASKSPILIPTGRIVTPGTGVKSVETEMLSMSLSSHRGAENGSMNYHATVGIRSESLNNKGRTVKVDSFFDITFTCSNAPDTKEMRCVVTSTKPKKKRDHRGHVTVLK